MPDLIDVGGPWKVLPPGVYDASLEEVKTKYSTNDHREQLLDGFEQGVAALRIAGCQTIYLDGGFVGENPQPSDFDCCWDPTTVDLDKLDPILLDFSNRRQAQKGRYGGEFFPCSAEAAPGQFFLSYFQKDKHTGKAKGIIRVH